MCPTIFVPHLFHHNGRIYPGILAGGSLAPILMGPTYAGTSELHARHLAQELADTAAATADRHFLDPVMDHEYIEVLDRRFSSWTPGVKPLTDGSGFYPVITPSPDAVIHTPASAELFVPLRFKSRDAAIAIAERFADVLNGIVSADASPGASVLPSPCSN
jgi:hypothetical protein